MEKRKDLLVAALENGTVIDHIPTNKLFTVASLLKLNTFNEPVLIGNNLSSNKIGKKGMIKIANRMLTDDEISRLAVVCPNIRLCIIRDYEVVEKKEVRLPETLENIVKCANPVCISNNEPMRSYFHVIDKENGIMKCHYCNKEQKIETAEFYKTFSINL